MVLLITVVSLGDKSPRSSGAPLFSPWSGAPPLLTREPHEVAGTGFGDDRVIDLPGRGAPGVSPRMGLGLRAPSER